MARHVAVIRFPGTNCEFDVVEAVESLGGTAEIVFHDQTSLGAADAVVVAGGFAHGDYLRPGAIARFSPVMDAVGAFAAAGGPVVGRPVGRISYSPLRSRMWTPHAEPSPMTWARPTLASAI